MNPGHNPPNTRNLHNQEDRALDAEDSKNKPEKPGPSESRIREAGGAPQGKDSEDRRQQSQQAKHPPPSPKQEIPPTVRRPSDPANWAEFVVAIAAVFSVPIAIGAVWVAKGALKTSESALIEARRANEITLRESQQTRYATLRPWLGVDKVIPAKPPSLGEQFEAIAQFVNVGGSPALDVRPCAIARLQQNEPTIEEIEDAHNHGCTPYQRSQRGAVFPTLGINISGFSSVMTKEMLMSANAGRETVFFWGYVEYRDTFGDGSDPTSWHKTTFCYWLGPKSRFVNCSKGNAAN